MKLVFTSPCVAALALAVTLAFLIPWREVGTAIRKRWFMAGFTLLRWRLQRRHRCTVIMLTGRVERAQTMSLVSRIQRAQTDRPLVLVIDTRGGDVDAGLQMLHALAAHRGPVHVRVPDECMSSGTVVACAADVIYMGPHATMGHTDAIAHVDPGSLMAGPTITAHTRGEPVDLVRSRHSLSYIADAIAKARQQRGDTPNAARYIAERLTLSDRDHFEPLFPEDVGPFLPVVVDHNPRWLTLAWLAGWAR